MKKVAKKVKVTEIVIGFSADDWELYASKPGAAEAADSMNKAFRKLILKHSTVADYSVHAVHGKMYDVLDEFKEFGATDTEPRYWVREILRDVYGEDACRSVF